MKDFNSNGILILLLVIVGIIALIYIRRKLKILKLPNVFLVTGAVKVGKSALSVHLAIKTIRKNVICWYIGRLLYWIKNHSFDGYIKKPMLYCNIPLNYPHNRLTKDIIMRKKRVPNKSVVLVDEASLFADSQLIKDKDINFNLMLFCKLFGHETHGGTLIFNSQCVSDLHYAIKRSCGRYLYIYQSTKYPFITLSKVREMVFSDDTSVVNDVSQDLEMSMRTMFYFNHVYKRYDSCCYSVLTDNLEYEVDYNYDYDKKNLKTKVIVSFNPEFEKLIKEGDVNEGN